MTKEKLLEIELSYGDIIVLYTWKYLRTKFKHETEYDGKENGNIVSPKGYRLFVWEKELYGKPYRVKNVVENQNTIIVNAYGKREISPEEIVKVIKQDSEDYAKWEDLL